MENEESVQVATAAICLQRRLRARLRNVIGMREFDTVIMNEVVRIQRAPLRAHSDDGSRDDG